MAVSTFVDNFFPSLRELAFSSPNQNNIPILGIKSSINLFYLADDFYSITFNGQTYNQTI